MIMLLTAWGEVSNCQETETYFETYVSMWENNNVKFTVILLIRAWIVTDWKKVAPTLGLMSVKIGFMKTIILFFLKWPMAKWIA